MTGRLVAITVGSLLAGAGTVWMLEASEAYARKKVQDPCSSDCALIGYDASTVRDGACWCIVDRVPTRWSDIASIPDRDRTPL